MFSPPKIKTRAWRTAPSLSHQKDTHDLTHPPFLLHGSLRKLTEEAKWHHQSQKGNSESYDQWPQHLPQQYTNLSSSFPVERWFWDSPSHINYLFAFLKGQNEDRISLLESSVSEMDRKKKSCQMKPRVWNHPPRVWVDSDHNVCDFCMLRPLNKDEKFENSYPSVMLYM